MEFLKKIKKHFKYWTPVLYDAYIGKKGIYILGYTKSGTNWLRNIVHRYYDVKYVPKYTLGEPLNVIRVYHLHRFINSDYYNKKTIYMIRDGRDTLISRYFTMVNQPSQKIMKHDFIKFSNKIPTSENIKELLPFYINFLKEYKKSTIDYVSHVNLAIQKNLFFIKYEDLKKDTFNEVKKVLMYLNPDLEIDEEKLLEAIDYCSIENAKKRQKVDTGFFRKGAGGTGDWKNYFNKQSAQLYNEYAGSVLIKLGYEQDEEWVRNFS